jgi:hypothetical protein
LSREDKPVYPTELRCFTSNTPLTANYPA